jgi:uncharacterized protein YfaQ (DUF2300 family)
MHTKDARAIGETEQRIYALPAWRETPFFTDRERAALAFTESVTMLADTCPTPGGEPRDARAAMEGISGGRPRAAVRGHGLAAAAARPPQRAWVPA